jgi:AcrR family transcriptional regulator
MAKPDTSATEASAGGAQRNGQLTKGPADDAVEKLLAAGSALLSEQGADGFTLREVSKRSGVSYGSLHWRFENKEALLNAVHDRINQQVLRNIDAFDHSEPSQDLNIFQATERAVRGVAAILEEEPALLRALNLHSTTDSQLTARVAGSVHRGGEAFGRALVPHLTANGDPSPEITAAAIFTIVSGSLIARLTWPEYQTESEMTWERLVDDLCRMSVAFLQESLPVSTAVPGAI